MSRIAHSVSRAGRTIVLGTVALAVTICNFAVSTPARAGGPLSQALCVNNQPASIAAPNPPLAVVNGQPTSYGYRSSFTIGAGVPVRDGDVIHLRATGTIKIGGWPWDPSYSPDGDTTSTTHTFWGGRPLPRYSLYGYLVATRQAFPIGRDSGCVVYHGPETWLWLAQNDDNTTDNTGRWDITIQHYNL